MSETLAAARKIEGKNLERYETLLQKQKKALVLCKEAAQKSKGMGNFKLVFFILILLFAAALFDLPISAFWLLVPIAVFLMLLKWHERIDHVLWRAQAREELYASSLARFRGEWRGKGEGGKSFVDAAHPFASDLDVFGEGGLFEMVSRAKTPFGKERLADWMKHPPLETVEINKRQTIVSAIEKDEALREAIAEASAITQRRDDAWRITKRNNELGLRTWAKAKEDFFLVEKIIAALLVLGTLAVFVCWGLGMATIMHATIALSVEALFAIYLRKRVASVLEGAASADRYLGVVSELLAALENAGDSHSVLKNELLHAESGDKGVPSVALHKLSVLTARAEQMRNAFFIPFALVLMWGSHSAFALAKWRKTYGAHVEKWLEAAAQLEAYYSLALFASEWPMGVYPEIKTEGLGFAFDELLHPLIDAQDASSEGPKKHAALSRGGVPNDVRLGGEHARLMIVSGSNMSGKSTLLRSVGSAMILARLGTKVCAQKAQLTPLRLGASLLVHDSLGTGTSRFYAELLRLKQVVDLARDDDAPRGLLYFMDEILSGTNSHDRQIGAHALMRELTKRRALGFITTHDLALTHFDPPLEGAVNMHFVDTFEKGRLNFDYQLREGVVDRSNAVALMESLELL